MSYAITNWENLPDTTSPLNKNNLLKIENELEKLDPQIPYTQATGTYTTAEWTTGTNTCIWTAPRTGLYILFAFFNIQNDSLSNAKVYKQFQLKGTAARLNGDILFYQSGPTESSSTENTNKVIAAIQTSTLVSATQGQTIIPYIHTPEAGIEWSVKLTGLFLK